MEFKFQKRRGIGNVITTLIILIASVVLGAGVIFFGGSMFSTNTQSEQVKVTNVNSWVGTDNQPNNATTSFAIQNTGSKAITLTDIKFRGIAVPNSEWYYCKDPSDCTSATSIQTPLPVDLSDPPTPSTWTMDTPGPISLAQGEAAVVYLRNAGNVQLIDAGNTYALQIQAGQASSVTQVSVESKS